MLKIHVILISASLFGSIYLFSTSLVGFNKKLIKQGKIIFGSFEVINLTVMFFSGCIMVFTVSKAFKVLVEN
jgi:hypothetical protein